MPSNERMHSLRFVDRELLSKKTPPLLAKCEQVESEVLKQDASEIVLGNASGF